MKKAKQQQQQKQDKQKTKTKKDNNRKNSSDIFDPVSGMHVGARQNLTTSVHLIQVLDNSYYDHFRHFLDFATGGFHLK